jgi:hypothetical protein
MSYDPHNGFDQKESAPITPGKIKIEKGIPIPRARGGVKSHELAAVQRLEVGDSVVLPKYCKAAMGAWQQRMGIKLTMRALNAETIRIWRTA